MAKVRPVTANQSIERHLRLATFASAVLIGGFGGWAATTELSGAVLASGRVVVDANVKKVQHPIGGIVSEINVKNGQRVTKGEVLIVLDATIARSNLAVITKALDSRIVRQRRLEAERDGRESFSLPTELVKRLKENELAELLETELGYFRSRRSARDGLRAQLDERIAQFDEQIKGLTRLSEAHADSLSLIREELVGVEDLYAKKLVAITRVMLLKREEADIRGKHAQIIADIAKIRGQVSEGKLQSLQIDEELREEVTGTLREIQEKSAELTERRVTALDQLQRIEIRSPANGFVHELAIHTVGGVIDPSATLMVVVPEYDNLSIEVRIDGQDRDQIHVGQLAMLRMTSFNQRTTPELEGEVTTVAADLVEDMQTGMHYYPVRISLRAGEWSGLEGRF